MPAFGGRPQLMKELKKLGVKLDMKWTVKEMRAKLEEAEDERQKAEAANRQSEETEGSH